MMAEVIDRMRYLTAFAVLLILHGCSSLHPPKQSGPTPEPAHQESAAVVQSPIICIDPGHPSEVNDGRTIQNGTSEVHVAWKVAVELQKLLEAKGYRVVMTKAAEDQSVMNKERALIGNRSHAALTVRLHCDSSSDQGYAVYYPDRQGTKDGVTGPAPAVIENSLRAAEAVHTGMAESLRGGLRDGGVRGDSRTLVGSKQGALTGSIFSEIPIVTVEMVVLSNARDAEFIKSEAGQYRMAEAIADGIGRFVDESSAAMSSGPGK